MSCLVVEVCWVGSIGSSLSLSLFFSPSIFIWSAKGTHKRAFLYFLKINFKRHSFHTIKCTNFKCTVTYSWQMTQPLKPPPQSLYEYVHHLKSCPAPHPRQFLTLNPNPRQPLTYQRVRFIFSNSPHKNGTLHCIYWHNFLFVQHNDLEIFYKQHILCNCWTVFTFVHMQKLLTCPSCPWIFGLFLVWAFCGHLCTSLCVDTCLHFTGVNIKG